MRPCGRRFARRGNSAALRGGADDQYRGNTAVLDYDDAEEQLTVAGTENNAAVALRECLRSSHHGTHGRSNSPFLFIRLPYMNILVRLILAASLCLAGCSSQPRRSESSTSRNRLQSLAFGLEAGSVTRIEVFHIPVRVETPVALSASDLERTFDYRLTLQTSTSPHATKALAAALRDSKAYESNNKLDVRFGVVFYGPDVGRVGSIYLGGDCKSGQVDDVSIEYVGGVCSWVTHALSGVL
jgi:hypothetical protein